LTDDLFRLSSTSCSSYARFKFSFTVFSVLSDSLLVWSDSSIFCTFYAGYGSISLSRVTSWDRFLVSYIVETSASVWLNGLTESFLWCSTSAICSVRLSLSQQQQSKMQPQHRKDDTMTAAMQIDHISWFSLNLYSLFWVSMFFVNMIVSCDSSLSWKMTSFVVFCLFSLGLL
jgi:hypothetical protein